MDKNKARDILKNQEQSKQDIAEAKRYTAAHYRALAEAAKRENNKKK
nr:hypothetical protein [uncultured bacterium]